MILEDLAQFLTVCDPRLAMRSKVHLSRWHLSLAQSPSRSIFMPLYIGWRINGRWLSERSRGLPPPSERENITGSLTEEALQYSSQQVYQYQAGRCRRASSRGVASLSLLRSVTSKWNERVCLNVICLEVIFISILELSRPGARVGYIVGVGRWGRLILWNCWRG